MGNDESMLRAEKISLKLEGNNGEEGKWIFRDLDLEIAANSISFLMGKSGIGKSLLLRSLGLLVPLQGGRILWKNRSIAKEEITGYRSSVQYLATGFGRGEETVGEQFQRIFNFKVYKEKGKKLDPANLGHLLERFGLGPAFLEKRSYQLSGGESQMAVLMRSFLLAPEVLLLDEPTSAMDGATKENAELLIQDYIIGKGRAAVWITHDREQALRLRHRILKLDKEKLVEEII